MDLDEIAEEEVSFGSSIIVPSVQELSKQPIIHVPPRYLRPDHHHHQPDTCLPSIPIIDFQKLHDHDSSELERLHSASTHWGFFQVPSSLFCFYFGFVFSSVYAIKNEKQNKNKK